MKNEILKGIFVGLLSILAVVSVGSFIGSSLSPYEPSPEARAAESGQEAAGEEAGSDETTTEGEEAP